MKKSLLITALCFVCTTQLSAQWTTVCGTGNGFVDNFEVYNNELYATGFFTTLCGTTNSHIAKLNGGSWDPAPFGYSYAGHQMKTIGNDLYFVGYQPAIDSNWVMKYDGSNFGPLGEGVYLTTAVTGLSQTANLYAVTEYNGHIIASGEFDRVGSKHISGIVQWNGTEWDSLGSGLSGNIAGTAPVMYPHDMCSFGTDLIVAGNFLKAGGITVNGVARWDGVQWHNLGSGFNGTVYGICVYNGELYAGGDFTMSGSNALKCIAKWDGTNWVDPGFRMYYNNPGYYSFVHTLKVFDIKMYISGGFDRIEVGSAVHHGQAICAYDGTTVDTLSGGLTGKEAEGIAFFNNELYAGGGINNSNSFIAKYNNNAGVDELESVPEWIIETNPAENTLTILGTSSGELISVFSLDGQLCCQATSRQSTTEMDVSNLKSGFYLVRIGTSQRRLLKK